MQETLRQTAPSAQTYASTHTAAPINGNGTTTASGLNTSSTHSDTTLQNASNIAGDGASHSTDIWEKGTDRSSATDSVVQKLQSNIQASVREATNGERTDPNVAEDLGHRSAGKQFLEGLGLGGDERKVHLRDVREQ